jgi:hypothetical protein
VLFGNRRPNAPGFAGLLRAAEHCLVSHASALKRAPPLPRWPWRLCGVALVTAMLSQTKEEKIVKLTDSQLIILSKAAAREDGAAVVPPKMNKAAAMKIKSSFIGRKLMREIRSKPGMPVWREDEDGRSMSLVITRAGRDTIGIDRAVETDRSVSSKSSAAKRADRYLAGAAPRPGSKQALVVEMLSKDQGVTLNALVNRLASPYDAGGLDGSSQARLCG